MNKFVNKIKKIEIPSTPKVILKFRYGTNQSIVKIFWKSGLVLSKTNHKKIEKIKTILDNHNDNLCKFLFFIFENK